jgi:predicted RNase H-like HicB family nuclease
MRFTHERYKASLLKHSFGDKKRMRYAVVIESGPENFSAYVPDLPGCIATGKTLEEVLTNIREATKFHLEGLRADGLPIPQPITRCEYIEAG